MSNASQAPWAALDRGYIVVKGGYTIASVNSHNTKEGKANAKLIASAPELLDALYTALPFVEDAKDDACYKSGSVAAALNKIKDAIKKAEGE